MKSLIITCLLLLCGLTACSSNSDQKTRIALLTPITHPSLIQIEKGFVETLEKNDPGKYQFTTFNAQGNKTLMRSEIEEIIRQNFDMVFTIGTLASQMTTEVFTRKGIETPIVFTCVNDPVGFRIVASEEHSDNMATGIKELLDFKQALLHLKRYKPELQTLLLVYNPSEPGLEKDQIQLKLLAKEMNIELLTVEVFQTNELIAKVPPFIGKADALIVLKDNSVVAGLDALVKLCNKHQIPLMASDLDSPDKGAAFGYGVYEIDFGIEAAKKALIILNEGIKPNEIPTTPVSEFHLRINKQAAIQQGVTRDYLNH